MRKRRGKYKGGRGKKVRRKIKRYRSRKDDRRSIDENKERRGNK